MSESENRNPFDGIEEQIQGWRRHLRGSSDPGGPKEPLPQEVESGGLLSQELALALTKFMLTWEEKQREAGRKINVSHLLTALSVVTGSVVKNSVRGGSILMTRVRRMLALQAIFRVIRSFASIE